MEFLNDVLSIGSSPLGGIRTDQAVLGLLLSFILGQTAAWAYGYTHAGLSYSRAFVQSIILLTIIISLAMMVIGNNGNNLVMAFGMIGALAVIRFRNVLKDTRDTAFIFFALVTGMATGTANYQLAILGTVVFCTVLIYLHWAHFGSRRTGDGFVRFQLETGKTEQQALANVLNRFCRSSHLVSQRFQETGLGELAYQLTMRDPAHSDALVDELRHLEGISHVTFVLHEEQAEV